MALKASLQSLPVEINEITFAYLLRFDRVIDIRRNPEGELGREIFYTTSKISHAFLVAKQIIGDRAFEIFLRENTICFRQQYIVKGFLRNAYMPGLRTLGSPGKWIRSLKITIWDYELRDELPYLLKTLETIPQLRSILIRMIIFEHEKDGPASLIGMARWAIERRARLKEFRVSEEKCWQSYTQPVYTDILSSTVTFEDDLKTPSLRPKRMQIRDLQMPVGYTQISELAIDVPT